MKVFDKRQLAQVMSVIELLGDYGECRNREKFKLEEDGIWAIKGGSARVYCFMAKGCLVVLTTAAIKKSQKASPRALKKAKKIRNDCVQSKY